jgi:hypothetical protein
MRCTALIGLLVGLTYSGSVTTDQQYVWVTQDLPPRKQWGSNYGYCGETSVVAAALKFGSYYSQWDVRDISVLFDPRNDQQHWYSVGTNDQIASTKLRLKFNEFPSYDPASTTKTYYLWLKEQTKAGNAVTITVFMNHYLFSGGVNKDPTTGFHYYDHIVSVAKVSSNYDDGEYHGDDMITFSDHGLWSPGGNPPYLFTYSFDEFCGNRTTSNSPDGPIYTMPCDVMQPKMLNFGIAHTGPRDDDNELVPVVVSTNVNYEKPEPFPRSSERPVPMPLVLTVRVDARYLEAGKKYVLYRYDDETKVPFAKFNKAAGSAAQEFEFVAEEGRDVVLTRDVMSDEKVIFRCVRSNAL